MPVQYKIKQPFREKNTSKKNPWEDRELDTQTSPTLNPFTPPSPKENAVVPDAQEIIENVIVGEANL